MFVHFGKCVGQRPELSDVSLRGLLHFGREDGLCAAQQLVVGGAYDGGQSVCLVGEGFFALRCGGGDGGLCGLDGIGRCVAAVGGKDNRCALCGFSGPLRRVFGLFLCLVLLFFLVLQSEPPGYFLVRLIVVGQFLAYFSLVEGPVESREEEYDDLRSHADEEHEVATRQVGQFEEGA